MKPFLRLPLLFNAARLQRDVERIPADLWTPHFQPDYYQGEWSGIALRSIGGSSSRLFPHRKAGGAYLDTPLLESCAAIAAVIDTFRCSKEMVRLLRLGSDSRILEHRDEKLNEERGVVRIHVPVRTNPGVAFHLNDVQVVMREGEAWVLDLSLPHRVENHGNSERTHLVLDCLSNGWLDTLFAVAEEGGSVAAH